MNDTSMGWKAFTIRVIEALRWPLVFAVAFFLVRDQIGRLIAAIAGKLAT